MGAYKKCRKDGSNAWYYNFSYHGTQYRAVGGTTKTQALRTLERVRSSVIDVTYQHARELNSKFDEAAEEFLNISRTGKKSWKRDEQIVAHLNKTFKGKILNHIKPQDIEVYKTRRKGEGVKNSTINREIAALKRIFYIAINNNHVRSNPVKLVKFLKEPPGRTRYLTEQEIIVLLKNCSTQIKPVVMTALYTGMRLQEILSLTWDCVHIANTLSPFLEIPISKNNSKRHIPLNIHLIELFGELTCSKIEHTPQVYLNRTNKPLRKISNQFKRALVKSNITDFSFHDLRHTFASYYVMNGGDLISLKEILGHSTIKMVERYAHLSHSHKLKLINNLNFSDNYCHPSVTKDDTACAK